MTGETPKGLRVLIAGGGTGGHLFPGIAVAEEVTRRPGGRVLFVGTTRGLEAKLVPQAGYPLEFIEVQGLKGKSVKERLLGFGRLPRSFFQSLRILRRFRPHLVLGVGGYASGPLVLAAALSRYPTAILEQNSVPGVTNRILGKFVKVVFAAFEEAARFFPRGKVRLTGNPVRRRFLESLLREPAAVSDGVLNLLVCGGSQGARAVNDLMPSVVAGLRDRQLTVRVRHQTGAADAVRIAAQYEGLGLASRVQVLPFIDDMAGALSEAHLVVARAGALTLAELAVVGRPALLIPFPYAADDHQAVNAAAFAQAGAALTLLQAEATIERVTQLLAELLENPARRAAMGAAMTALGRPHAAREIVDALEALAKEGRAAGASPLGTPSSPSLPPSTSSSLFSPSPSSASTATSSTSGKGSFRVS